MLLRFNDKENGLDPITTGEAPYLTAQYREAMREIRQARTVEQAKAQQREIAKQKAARRG